MEKPFDGGWLDLCGIRLQLQRIGSSDRWMLIAGGDAAREALKRVTAAPSLWSGDAVDPTEPSLAWVVIFIDDQEAAALRAQLPFPQPHAMRQFAWFVSGNANARNGVGQLQRLCLGPATPLPEPDKPHEPNQFI